MGYATVEESARAIIAERGQPQTSEWVFFDRGIVDALGLLHEVSPLPASELQATLASYPFHPSVFVLPPWEAI